MRTILVPLDGSRLAESALPTAAALAARTGARIVVTSVHQPELPVRGGQGAMAYDQRWDEEARAALADGLEAARKQIAEIAPNVHVDLAVLEGDVSPTLAAHVTSVNADLVVMTSHGRGGTSRFWLGSVTDELVRRVRTPLMVLRAGSTTASPRVTNGEFRRVLVPLDGTPGSETAIDASERIIGTRGVQYTLLRVVPPLHPLLQSVASDRELERDAEEQRDLCERELRDVDSRLRAQGFDVSCTMRIDLQTAPTILAVADEIGADLIAIATHGRGRFGRFMLGSVADKVLRGASVPVLVHRLVEDTTPAAEPLNTTVTDTAVPSEANLPTVPAPRLDRVVIGLDFAEPSRYATEWTARHLAPGAELVLVHAVSVPEPPAFVGYSPSARKEVIENVHRGADIRLRELVRGIGVPQVWPEIRDGAPHTEINAMAAAYRADMIVVGAHGERSGLSAVVGTTAQRVLRTAPVPVLLARALPDGPPRRLLAAIDGSPETDLVVAWAGFLGARFGAAVVFLHVVDPLVSGAVVGASESERGRAFDQAREVSSRWLEAKARACRESVAAVTTAVAFGQAAAEILDTARRIGADLIVMGRGRSGAIARTLLGSTTERILRDGDRPVLVAVRTDETPADGGVG